MSVFSLIGHVQPILFGKMTIHDRNILNRFDFLNIKRCMSLKQRVKDKNRSGRKQGKLGNLVNFFPSFYNPSLRFLL